jgi:hypothetical protein
MVSASSQRERTHLLKLGWPAEFDVAVVGAGGVVCEGDCESDGCFASSAAVSMSMVGEGSPQVCAGIEGTTNRSCKSRSEPGFETQVNVR